MLLLALAIGLGWATRIVGSRVEPSETLRLERTERRVRRILRAARELRWASGAFPATLSDLAVASGWISSGDVDQDVRVRDPFAPGSTVLRYSTSSIPVTVRVRSVGPDGRADTADDLVWTSGESPVARIATRMMQRALLSSYLDSSLLGGGRVAPSTRSEFGRQLRARRRAAAQRLGASSAQRDAAETRIAACEAEIARIRQVHGLTDPIPTRAIGDAGMLDAIGRSEEFARDAFATEWLVGISGFVSAGGDRRGGGYDDL